MNNPNESAAPPIAQEMVPVPLVKRWPVFRTRTVSLTSPSTQTAATPVIRVLVRSAASLPTVIAMPMTTRDTMISWSPSRPARRSRLRGRRRRCPSWPR